MQEQEYERATLISGRGKIATVRIQKHAECDGCKICAFKPGKNFVHVKALNKVGAKAGDEVGIRRVKDNKTLASFIVYGIPVIFACAFLAIGLAVFESQLITSLFCLGGIVLGFVIVIIIDRLIGRKSGFGCEIVRIIDLQSAQTYTDRQSAPSDEQVNDREDG